MHTQRQLASVGFLTAIVLGLTAFAVAPVFAQTDDYGTGTTSGTYCPQLSQTVVRGSSGNQVLELQKFLSDYYDVPPTTIQTGYFGRITQGYVIQFQKEQGLPSYGIAGSMTRAAIAKLCGGSNVINDFTSNPTFGVAPLTVGFGFTTKSRDAHRVDFGDGEIGNLFSACDEPTYTEYCLTHRYTQHTYKIPGTYTAKLLKLPPCNDVIMNAVPSSGTLNVQSSSAAMCSGEGGATLKSVTITVGGGSSQTFSASPTSGQAPLSVNFQYSHSKDDSYSIDYGDGAKGALQHFETPCMPGSKCTGYFGGSHTYSLAGTYTATLSQDHADCAMTNSIPGNTYCSTRVVGTVTIIVSGSSVSQVTLKPSLISSGTGTVYVSLRSTGLTDANAKGGYVDWGDGSTQQLTCDGVAGINGEGSSGVDSNGNCMYGYLSVHNHNYSVVAGQTYPYTIRLIGTGGELARYQVSIYEGMPQYYSAQ